MARYAIETIGYRRYEWKCHSYNEASKSAARRYGFIYEDARALVIAKGRNRDTAMFSMLDSEWPLRKTISTLAGARNFTAGGRQNCQPA